MKMKCTPRKLGILRLMVESWLSNDLGHSLVMEEALHIIGCFMPMRDSVNQKKTNKKQSSNTAVHPSVKRIDLVGLLVLKKSRACR